MWPFDLFSTRGKALSAYKRGLKRASLKDNVGAIADYTAVVGMSGAPQDVQAMAMFNRALVHSANKQYEQARADLDAVLKMAGAPADVKAKAKEKLVRMDRRSQ